MKETTIEKIALKIAQKLSLKHHKSTAYKVLTTQNRFCVVLGIDVDTVRFIKERFCLNYFIQPLYIPSDFIKLSLGNRLGEWEIENMQEALIAAQNTFNTYLGNISNIETILMSVLKGQLQYWGQGCSKPEFFAYSYLAIQNQTEALKYLNKVISFEQHEFPEWFETEVNRAKQMRELLKKEKWSEIFAQMQEWQNYTSKILGFTCNTTTS